MEDNSPKVTETGVRKFLRVRISIRNLTGK